MWTQNGPFLAKQADCCSYLGGHSLLCESWVILWETYDSNLQSNLMHTRSLRDVERTEHCKLLVWKGWRCYFCSFWCFVVPGSAVLLYKICVCVYVVYMCVFVDLYMYLYSVLCPNLINMYDSAYLLTCIHQRVLSFDAVKVWCMPPLLLVAK